MKIDSENLTLESTRCDAAELVRVANLRVKKFRRLLRKRGGDTGVHLFQVVQVNAMRSTSKVETKRELLRIPLPKLNRIFRKYDKVFQEELPPGLPPKRSVDHEIEFDKDWKPSHRPLYQLSPAELEAAKSYVRDLLRKGKIRPTKSPHSASLFFVKEKGKPLRGAVDSRTLNHITKRNNAFLRRSDEMIDMLGEARFFSKLDLKTGFHQIRVLPEDIEKTAFNTKFNQFEYLVMPMGLCNAPAAFQSLMNRIFYDFVDDFLVVLYG